MIEPIRYVKSFAESKSISNIHMHITYDMKICILPRTTETTLFCKSGSMLAKKSIDFFSLYESGISGEKDSKTFKFVKFVSGSSEKLLYFPPQLKVLPFFTTNPSVEIPFLFRV